MIRYVARLGALLTAASLAAGIVGCGKAQDPPGKNETPEQQQQRKEKAGD